MRKLLNLEKSRPGPFEALCKGPLNAKVAKIGKIWAGAFRGSLQKAAYYKNSQVGPNPGPGPSRLSVKAA